MSPTNWFMNSLLFCGLFYGKKHAKTTLLENHPCVNPRFCGGFLDFQKRQRKQGDEDPGRLPCNIPLCVPASAGQNGIPPLPGRDLAQVLSLYSLPILVATTKILALLVLLLWLPVVGKCCRSAPFEIGSQDYGAKFIHPPTPENTLLGVGSI